MGRIWESEIAARQRPIPSRYASFWAKETKIWTLRCLTMSTASQRSSHGPPPQAPDRFVP